MKSINKSEVILQEDDLLPEYEFDFSKAKPNRFASILKAQDRLIQLEPDVYKVFNSSDKVNKALRALIDSMPNHVAL